MHNGIFSALNIYIHKRVNIPVSYTHLIIDASATSRSAFYHHFHGKEDLLFTIAYVYDIGYDAWYAKCDLAQHAIDKDVYKRQLQA